MFLADPPLMFWHTAAALGQQYWLLPVPQAYWMQEDMQARHIAAVCFGCRSRCMEKAAPHPCCSFACAGAPPQPISRWCCACTALQVPAEEVLDILTAVLSLQQSKAAPTCPAGSYASSSGSMACTACSAGSYAFNAGSPACKTCAAGRAAPVAGSSACRTCQPGTYSSADGKACVACPEGGSRLQLMSVSLLLAAAATVWSAHICTANSSAGTFSVLPGAWEAAQCLTPEQRRQQQQDQATNIQVLRCGAGGKCPCSRHRCARGCQHLRTGLAAISPCPEPPCTHSTSSATLPVCVAVCSKLSPVFADQRRRLIEQVGARGKSQGRAPARHLPHTSLMCVHLPAARLR